MQEKTQGLTSGLCRSTNKSKEGKPFASAQGWQEFGLRGSLKLFNKQLTQGMKGMSPWAGLELLPPSREPGRERLSGWAQWVQTVGLGPLSSSPG